jgi:hypothetical protein
MRGRRVTTTARSGELRPICGYISFTCAFTFTFTLLPCACAFSRLALSRFLTTGGYRKVSRCRSEQHPHLVGNLGRSSGATAHGTAVTVGGCRDSPVVVVQRRSFLVIVVVLFLVVLVVLVSVVVLTHAGDILVLVAALMAIVTVATAASTTSLASISTTMLAAPACAAVSAALSNAAIAAALVPLRAFLPVTGRTTRPSSTRYRR